MTTTSNRGAHVALWVTQVLLALIFGASGLLKFFISAQPVGWAAHTPAWLVTAVAAVEVVAAVGLVVPALLKLPNVLTIASGVLLALAMLVVAQRHLVLGETQQMMIDLMLGAAAGFVAWGRVKAAPIAPRG